MPYAESADAQIFYDVDGDGPALVFLHGGGGNGAAWFQQIGYFRDRYTCIIIDNRCFGRSQPIDPSIYWPKLFGGDVLAVMDKLDIDRAALVCQSLGGWTGLRLALSDPDRITHLVVSDSPMGIDNEAAKADAEAFANRWGKKAANVETEVLNEDFRRENPELVFLYRQISAFNPLNDRGLGAPLAAHERVQRYYAPDYVLTEEQVAGVKCPTLLINGAEDIVVTPRTMEGFSKMIPGAEFEEIEGAAHSPYFEKPDRFNEAVSSFLSRHPVSN